MFFTRVYEKGLAQASYFIGCQETKEAIVIDPKRDTDTYLEIAEKEKLNIIYATETHIHADFLSGSREIAAATGAEILLSDEGGDEWQYNFQHKGLRDKDKFSIGNILFEVMHTPGHTPEHISFLLTDTKASTEPMMIFTGDFVFVGDVGRPDLLEKAAGVDGAGTQSAKQMFRSLKKFKALPDHLQVWPGHGAGSACGKAIGSVPGSTAGYEKLSNVAFKIENENKFVEMILDGQPEPPKYFSMMKMLNKSDRSILKSITYPKKLSHKQFEVAAAKGYRIIDVRNKLQFAAGYYPGSINIQDNNSFTTWAGWVLDYSEPFILIANDDRIDALTRSLIRIGLENILGYINEDEILLNRDNVFKKINLIDPAELKEKLHDVHLIDVRNNSEYIDERIPGSENIFAGYIPDNLNKIDKDKQTVVYCTSGDRSSLAASILMRSGYSYIYNLATGIEGWKQAGLSTEK